ncbi:carbohydrate-binding protein [Streptacidiphilus pinicola]|uniref:Carbohydrate-binding protein n=1 Tax=Streptacidiphilus pinicola TaxID=2219663 RepID=A0A2X0JBG4_9ACTN|nr:carbohydrate binding domain-containing protein [Streptacidiphilus pinicola]RAG84888.1 carbohydrate-binding protein [Streptacidiphilus pinicola]
MDDRRAVRVKAALAACTAGLLGVGGLALVGGAAQAATGQLLVNGGFESGNLSGWSCSANDKVVSSPVAAGSYALSGTPAGQDDAQCAQTVAVVPNSTYTLSGQVEGNYVYLGDTGTGTTDTSTWTPGASSWSSLSTTFTTGASTTSVTVWVHGWYGQGTFGADELSLTGPVPAGGGGGTPSPSASATSTGSPSASPSPSPSSSATTPPPPVDTGFHHPVYFMPLDNSPQAVSDIIAGSGENQFNLAFVLDSGGCTPAWGGNASTPVSSDTAVAADISAIRAAGGDAAVSFGGYNGTELGSSCGSSSALAAAYQQVITKYNLTRIDLDWENTALDANMALRWGAIKQLEAANPNLVVTLTIPATTVGLPLTGRDEIQQAINDGARIDRVNVMDFDFGLNGGTQTAAAETVAADTAQQLQTLYGWSAATAWSHLSVQLMNGHTDQPSELYTQSTFTDLLGYVQANHAAAFSYWDVNRDRACDPSVVHNWADGACSSVTQNPYDFTKIITQYNG